MPTGVATAREEFELKESLLARLRVAGYNVLDFGVHFRNCSDDYREFVIPLGESIAGRRLERGSANRVPGVRAALPPAFSARQGVDVDNIPAICLAKVVGREEQGL